MPQSDQAAGFVAGRRRKPPSDERNRHDWARRLPRLIDPNGSLGRLAQTCLAILARRCTGRRQTPASPIPERHLPRLANPDPRYISLPGARKRDALCLPRRRLELCFPDAGSVAPRLKRARIPRLHAAWQFENTRRRLERPRARLSHPGTIPAWAVCDSLNNL